MEQSAELILPENPLKPIPFHLPEPDPETIRLITLFVLPSGEIGFCQGALTADLFKKTDDSIDDQLLSLTSKTLGKLIRNKLAPKPD